MQYPLTEQPFASGDALPGDELLSCHDTWPPASVTKAGSTHIDGPPSHKARHGRYETEEALGGTELAVSPVEYPVEYQAERPVEYPPRNPVECRAEPSGIEAGLARIPESRSMAGGTLCDDAPDTFRPSASDDTSDEPSVVTDDERSVGLESEVQFERLFADLPDLPRVDPISTTDLIERLSTRIRSDDIDSVRLPHVPTKLIDAEIDLRTHKTAQGGSLLDHTAFGRTPPDGSAHEGIDLDHPGFKSTTFDSTKLEGAGQADRSGSGWGVATAAGCTSEDPGFTVAETAGFHSVHASPLGTWRTTANQAKEQSSPLVDPYELPSESSERLNFGESKVTVSYESVEDASPVSLYRDETAAPVAGGIGRGSTSGFDTGVETEAQSGAQSREFTAVQSHPEHETDRVILGTAPTHGSLTSRSSGWYRFRSLVWGAPTQTPRPWRRARVWVSALAAFAVLAGLNAALQRNRGADAVVADGSSRTVAPPSTGAPRLAAQHSQTETTAKPVIVITVATSDEVADADSGSVATAEQAKASESDVATDLAAEARTCHPAYDPCIAFLPGEAMDCSQIDGFVWLNDATEDPYNLDHDLDGIGCN